MDTLSYIIGRNSAGGGTGSTPSWSDITGKPFNTIGAGLEVDSGALKECVTLYTEDNRVTYGPGLVITNWIVDAVNKAIADDSVVLFNPSGTYKVTARTFGNILYTGTWNVSDNSWSAGDHYTFSYSIEAGGKGSDLRFVCGIEGISPNIDWAVIEPLDAEESYLTEANVTAIGFMAPEQAYWGTKQTGSLTVHELPSQYIETALTPYAQTSELATVAFSGSYNDLTNKPTIIPACTETPSEAAYYIPKCYVEPIYEDPEDPTSTITGYTYTYEWVPEGGR